MISSDLLADTVKARVSQPNIIEIDGITKLFGKTVALNKLSISVRRGESHGLVGRNGAGKSTLVSILTGLNKIDSGRFLLNGRNPPLATDRNAWRAAVACVYQHRTLVPDLSVAENLYLGRYLGKSAISWRELNKRAAEELASWDVPLSPQAKVRDLGVGQAQMLEIARALSQGSRFVILDEPTAQLISTEIDHLMLRVNQLRGQGVTFLFISHHLDEIPQVCDSVTVLRNGRDVLCKDVKSISTAEMVSAMVGDEAAGKALAAREHFVRKPISPASPIVLRASFQMEGLQDRFQIEVREGEVVGIAGHTGSGTRKIAMAITGHDQGWNGLLSLKETPVQQRWNPAAAVSSGVSLLPEDRKSDGLVGCMSIEDNLTMPSLKAFSRIFLLDGGMRRRFANQAREMFGIACRAVTQRVDQLSGGNQQKVLLGSTLSTKPAVLVLVHPTAGVDIASKATILELVEKHRESGLAIVMVSDEPEELAYCDRVQVWVRGRMVTEASGLNEDALVSAMEGIARSSEVS